MGTKIEWTDETWPVVTGCTHAGGPGCDNCYGARMVATRLRDHPRYKGLATIYNGKPKWTGKVNLNYDVLEQPLHWRKPRMIFVASMSDWLHLSVPELFIYRILDITQETPQHVYQFLTKRASRLPVIVKNWMLDRGLREPPRNIWQGTSIEDQAAADERISWLLQTPAAVRFVNVEPMLGAVEFLADFNVNWLGEERIQYCNGGCLSSPVNGLPYCPGHEVGGINWVICGGESGPGARPMHPDWARSLRDQCQAAGTPYFFKQWGEWLGVDFTGNEVTTGIPLWTRADGLSGQIGKRPEMDFGDGHGAVRIGRKRAGRLLDGQVWDQFPVSVTG